MTLIKVYVHCDHPEDNNYVLIHHILGQPIAWCISDQETSDVVEYFLQSLKNRSAHATVSVLMTDDGIEIRGLGIA